MGWFHFAAFSIGLMVANAVCNVVPTGNTAARLFNETTFNTSDIMSTPTSSFRSYAMGDLSRGTPQTFGIGVFPAITPKHPKRFQWNCTTSPVFTWGDNDNGGAGVFITNADTTSWQAFFLYHNLCDSIPFKYIWIGAGLTQFISVPPMFEGRVVRGNDEWNLGGISRPLGTWFEFSLDNSSRIWGDVSLIRGCDGSVLVWALDNSGAWTGFTQNILDGAPLGAYTRKPSGQWVLKATEIWNGSTDPIPRDWEIQEVGADHAYIDDNDGNPVIASTNGRFGTYWSQGRI